MGGRPWSIPIPDTEIVYAPSQTAAWQIYYSDLWTHQMPPWLSCSTLVSHTFATNLSLPSPVSSLLAASSPLPPFSSASGLNDIPISIQTIPFSNDWGCRTFQNAFHIHVIPMRCLSTFNCCGCAYGCTLTLLPPQMFFTDLGELDEILGNANVQPYHYAIGEAEEPFKLHPTSMSYLYEVFEHLQLLCVDIWVHTHSVTITDFSPDLGEWAKSLGDVRL